MKLLLIAFTFTLQNAQATELEILSDIVGMYQQQALAVLKNEIRVVVEESERLNANVTYQGIKHIPVLTYYTGYLEAQTDDDVVFVTCHELGHFFGDRSVGTTASGNAIENEADYFLGKCAVRYYQEKRGLTLEQAQQLTIINARKSRQVAYKVRIDPDQARTQIFTGVNQTYAEPECRVLSAIHGALGWRRPTCWYNP